MFGELINNNNNNNNNTFGYLSLRLDLRVLAYLSIP
jgi:hypothetical protein